MKKEEINRIDNLQTENEWYRVVNEGKLLGYSFKDGDRTVFLENCDIEKIKELIDSLYEVENKKGLTENHLTEKGLTEKSLTEKGLTESFVLNLVKTILNK